MVNSNSQFAEGDAILDSEDMKKLFVNKIPIGSSDDEIKSFFEEISGGTVNELSIVRKEGVTKYNFGFLTFDNSSMLDEVTYKEKELLFKGAALEVNRAVPKESSKAGVPYVKTKKLFLANIPKTGLNDADVKRYFDQQHNPKYGTVESVQFIKVKDEAGTATDENKGFGFVTVSSEHLADTMSIQHAEFEIGGHKLRLKKSDREQQGGRGGGRGGGRRGGGRGGATSQYSASAYSGYGSYGQGYGGWGGYDAYYGGYGVYPQYGVSSAVRGGGGGGGRGAKTGGRGGANNNRGGGGKRFTPYTKSS